MKGVGSSSINTHFPTYSSNRKRYTLDHLELKIQKGGFFAWLFRSKIQSQPPIRQNPKYSTNLAYTTSIGQFFELKTIKTSFGAAGWSLEVVSQLFNFDPKSWCTPLKRENRIFEGSWKSGFVGSHDLKFYTSVSELRSAAQIFFHAIRSFKNP